MEDITGGIESTAGSPGEPVTGTEGTGGIAEKPVRRRGRPPKSESVENVGKGGGVIPEIDGTGSGNTDPGAGSGSGGDRGKRGRKPGKDKKAPKADRVAALSKVLALVHGALAGLLNAPEMNISQQESGLLSEAMVDCADAWGFNPVSDPRVVSSVMLGGIMVAVYGPRIQAIKQRKQGEREHNITPG